MPFMDGLLQRRRLTTAHQDELLAELRGLLEALDAAFERFGPDVDPGDRRALRETIDHLEELFLIVIAGEFNSGKSSFLNALLGEQILPEGVTPTTDTITLLQYGEEVSSALRSSGLRVTTYPAEVLRQLLPTNGTQRAFNQCRHPPPRTVDAPVHSARRSGPVYHLSRPSFHRE
jgi:replication fork clamp-binding protein CrfC